jgi:hypothetical protein
LEAYRQAFASTTLVFVGTFIDGNRDFSIPRLVAPGYTLETMFAPRKPATESAVIALGARRG